MTCRFIANFIYFNFDSNNFFQNIENSGVIERKRKKDQKKLCFLPTYKLAGVGGGLKLGFLLRASILKTYPKIETTLFFAYQNICVYWTTIDWRKNERQKRTYSYICIRSHFVKYSLKKSFFKLLLDFFNIIYSSKKVVAIDWVRTRAIWEDVFFSISGEWWKKEIGVNIEFNRC